MEVRPARTTFMRGVWIPDWIPRAWIHAGRGFPVSRGNRRGNLGRPSLSIPQQSMLVAFPMRIYLLRNAFRNSARDRLLRLIAQGFPRSETCSKFAEKFGFL